MKINGTFGPWDFFNNIELLCNVHIFICWYESKGDHSLVPGNSVEWRKESRTACKKKDSSPVWIQFCPDFCFTTKRNYNVSIRRVLVSPKLSIKAFGGFFTSLRKGQKISTLWNVYTTFYYECPQTLQGNRINVVFCELCFRGLLKLKAGQWVLGKRHRALREIRLCESGVCCFQPALSHPVLLAISC